MSKTLFKSIPLASLARPEQLGYPDEAYGWRKFNDYYAERKKYLGKVLQVSDSEGYHSTGWDDGYHETSRTALVWDSQTGTAKSIVTDVASDRSNRSMVSAWEVDATPETVAAYRKWAVMKSAPELADFRAKEARAKYIATLRDERAAIEGGSLRRGDLYEVVAGRKYPLGLRGKVFWVGSNKWGQSVGLTTSDRKLPNGRNADVIFISPKNLMKVLTEDEAKRVEGIKADLAKADEVEKEAYREYLLKQYEEYAAAWGVSVDAILKRTEQVLTEEITSLRARAKDIGTNHWACDGPAYTQVERECESIDRKIRVYKRVLEALAPTATPVAA